MSGNPAGNEILISGGSYPINNLLAGNYTVTVTDASANGGCLVSSNFTITQPNGALNATAGNLSHNGCNGTSIGSATITATNGTAPYNVSWSGPSSGNPAGNEILISGGTYTISSLPAGVYTATVTDANNCNTTVSFTINQPAALSITRSTVAVSCFGGNNGTALLTVSGGNDPYNVSWTGPVSGNPAGYEINTSGGIYLIDSLPTGTYTATINNYHIYHYSTQCSTCCCKQ
ncbi:MAG: hypothetical protein EBT27_10005 [Betaproteobacteria bacterium]|nr:hypothetical protein [Betaproteobacteria bacterium]